MTRKRVTKRIYFVAHDEKEGGKSRDSPAEFGCHNTTNMLELSSREEVIDFEDVWV